MGEVYVRVRLSNNTDVEMVERGLLPPDQVRTCEVEALVDTGATRSIIPSEVAHRLGLSIHDRTFGRLADGSRVPVSATGAIRFEIYDRVTVEDAFVLGDEVLIGQTVLESTDLLVDCTNRRVIPNPAHPDGPTFRL